MKYREIITFEKGTIVLYHHVHYTIAIGYMYICQLPVSICNISLILCIYYIFKKHRRDNG